MADPEDDPWGAPPRKSPGPAHILGEALDRLSIHEIDERIEALRREIERLQEQRRAKSDSRAHADSVFGSPRLPPGA